MWRHHHKRLNLLGFVRREVVYNDVYLASPWLRLDDHLQKVDKLGTSIYVWRQFPLNITARIFGVKEYSVFNAPPWAERVPPSTSVGHRRSLSWLIPKSPLINSKPVGGCEVDHWGFRGGPCPSSKRCCRNSITR